jgi:hypothetical protein
LRFLSSFFLSFIYSIYNYKKKMCTVKMYNIFVIELLVT